MWGNPILWINPAVGTRLSYGLCPVELRIWWACRISSDLLASTKLGKFEPEGAKHRGVEAPGIVPMLRFHKRAILLSREVNSKSVRGVTLR